MDSLTLRRTLAGLVVLGVLLLAIGTPLSDRVGGSLYIWGVSALLAGVVPIVWLAVAPERPMLAVIASTLLFVGFIGAVTFPTYGIFEDHAERHGVTEATLEVMDEDLVADVPQVTAIPGLLFPVALLVLALAAWRSGLLTVPGAVLLVLAALTFPAGRAADVQPVAHVTDALLVVAFGWLAYRFVGAQSSATPLMAPEAA